MDISLVIPAYNEEESIPELHQWIKKVLDENKFTYEIIYIDDGSRDNTWEAIRTISEHDEQVKGIKFIRNYGKSPALYCGFEMAKGDVVITMDADLQDNPEEIPELYNMIKNEGYDLVSGWKRKRHDPLFRKRLPSKFYNWTVRKISGIKLHDFNCGLKAYKNKVVKSIEVYGEMHRYIPVLAKWAGFIKIGEKEVKHQERKYGMTKFGIERFIKGPLDLLSVIFISRFGKRPMHLFGTWGLIVFFLGGIITVYIIAQKLYRIKHELPVRDVVDQPLFFLSLLLVVVGVQLFMTGFIAELVSRNAIERNNYKIDIKLD
ncbi:glycosyltransferase family 2 protein [Bacteroidota bacterium]